MDLKEVQQTVWKARKKWYNIGLELNIDPDTLDVVEENCRADCEKCFTAMLKIWLKPASPKPTWTALAKALQSPTVGYSNLAHFQ